MRGDARRCEERREERRSTFFEKKVEPKNFTYGVLTMVE